jgi:hypothetical protein
MNAGFTPKSIALFFIGALFFYFGGFYGLEYLRVRKGPWEVSFEPDGVAGRSAPAVIVQQPSVGVSQVTLVFQGEKTTNAPAESVAGTVRFDTVEKNALFGDVIYEDLTFLPGVITFNLFGHEIELMPRVLVVNKKEIPWQSGAVIDVWPTNKPAVPPTGPKGNRPQR